MRIFNLIKIFQAFLFNEPFRISHLQFFFSGVVIVWDLSREDDMVLTSSGIGDDSHREPVSKVIWVPDTASLKKNKFLVRLIHSQSFLVFFF